MSLVPTLFTIAAVWVDTRPSIAGTEVKIGPPDRQEVKP